MEYTTNYADAYLDFIRIRDALTVEGVEVLGCGAGEGVFTFRTDIAVPASVQETLGLTEV